MSFRMLKPALALVMAVALIVMSTSCSAPERTSTNPEAGVNAGPDGKPAPFREPIRLSSEDGVLEVRLSAHQGTANLDTVAEPVTNFMR